MNILHLSPYVPDTRAAHAGGVCMGKMVETLKQRHRVTVLTFCNDAREAELLKSHPDYHVLRTSPLIYVLKVLARPWLPNMFALRSGRRYRKLLSRLIDRNHIDVVHAEYTAMGQYAALKRKYPALRFSLVEHDVVAQSYTRQLCESKGLKKCYLALELKKVKKAEARYLAQADQVFTLNDKDKALLQSLYGITNAEVIRPWYGTDFAASAAVPPAESTAAPAASHAETIAGFAADAAPEPPVQSLCFIGHMGREENHQAALRLIRIFQSINNPAWTLRIIGAHPKPDLLREQSDRIQVTGFVEDINAEIRRCRFAVFPLTMGAGIKFKVLLACGLGLPVITGAVGAEGIDPDFSVLLPAETDAEYKAQIESLMNNPELCRRKSAESLAFVKRRFNWAETEALLDRIYPGEAPR